MRSISEIEAKRNEINVRVYKERNLEVATRASCEVDALNWVLGDDVALHDMSTLEFKPDGTYIKVPWDGKE